MGSRRHARRNASLIMETPQHPMATLFAQLGLDPEPSAIEQFVATHPLPADIRLADAPFWTPAQAAFLREELLEDADWVEVIDALDRELR